MDEAADGKGNVMYCFVTRDMMLRLIDAYATWDGGFGTVGESS